jgi:iron complex transport system permease protein
MNKNYILFYILLFLLLLCYFSLKFGITNYSYIHLYDAIFKKNLEFENQFIIYDVRLPRIIAGALCGAAFALSGSLLQTVFRNPMAAPDILGINSACSFCILLFSTFLYKFIHMSFLISSFIGALSGFLIAIFASIENKKIYHAKLIIVGIAIGVLFKALCQFLIMQSDEKQSAFFSFITGTLYLVSWDTVYSIFIPSLFLIIISFFLHKKLDVLLLNEDVSNSIGFHITKWKIIIIFISLALASVAVSGCGSLGFVGLISPNISKILFGSFHKFNLFGSALIGAVLTVFSDFLARVLFPPYEIPAGLITIIIGVPYFIYLMKKMRNHI